MESVDQLLTRVGFSSACSQISEPTKESSWSAQKFDCSLRAEPANATKINVLNRLGPTVDKFIDCQAFDIEVQSCDETSGANSITILRQSDYDGTNLQLPLCARVAQSVAHRTYEAVLPELCEGFQFESGREQKFFSPNGVSMEQNTCSIRLLSQFSL